MAIDGSKFQAVASSRKHLTPKKLKQREAVLDKRIARYLAQLDEADRGEDGESIDRSAVQTALQELQVKKANLKRAIQVLGAQKLMELMG